MPQTVALYLANLAPFGSITPSRIPQSVTSRSQRPPCAAHGSSTFRCWLPALSSLTYLIRHDNLGPETTRYVANRALSSSLYEAQITLQKCCS
jgi:hypothetical protein